MEFPHLCIITENPVDWKHVQCVRFCNFTEHPLKGKEKYAINLSRFELPPEVYSYFKIPKYSNWIFVDRTVYTERHSQRTQNSI